MEQILKINLTLPPELGVSVRKFVAQNNYIRTTDAIRYLIGSGLRREAERGTFLSVKRSPSNGAQ